MFLWESLSVSTAAIGMNFNASPFAYACDNNAYHACIAGVAGHAHRHWGDEFTASAIYVRVMSMIMLTLSIVIAVWAGYNFNHRANLLQ